MAIPINKDFECLRCMRHYEKCECHNPKEPKQMNTTTEQSQAPESTEPRKRSLNADEIQVAMSKLFMQLETNFLITEANLRGALTTLLHRLDKAE